MKIISIMKIINGAVITLMLLFIFSNNAFAWSLIKNFNSGSAGDSAVGSDAFSGSASGSYYSNVEVSEGPLSAELNISQGQTGFGRWGGIINVPSNLYKGDEIWVRVKIFMPLDFNYDSTSGGNRLKFLRLHTRSPSSANQGYNDWYINPKGSSTPFSFIYEGEQVWSHFGTGDDVIQLGRWEVYEMYLYLDNLSTSNGGKARIRVWKDGLLLKDITERKTLKDADSYLDNFYIFTYWNGGSPKTQKMWIDDIVIMSNLPASRDMAGNPYIGVAPSSNFKEPSPPSSLIITPDN